MSKYYVYVFFGLFLMARGDCAYSMDSLGALAITPFACAAAAPVLYRDFHFNTRALVVATGRLKYSEFVKEQDLRRLRKKRHDRATIIEGFLLPDCGRIIEGYDQLSSVDDEAIEARHRLRLESYGIYKNDEEFLQKIWTLSKKSFVVSAGVCLPLALNLCYKMYGEDN